MFRLVVLLLPNVMVTISRNIADFIHVIDVILKENFNAEQAAHDKLRVRTNV